MSTGKTIFITGAGSGIGKAVAELFTKKGWFTGIYDIDSKKAASAAKEIGEDNCCFGEVDVSDRNSVENALGSFAVQTGGKLNVLFNNAGILRAGFFSQLSLEEQLLQIDINLKGVINCSYSALPYLRKTRDSRIINMSSASAVYGTAHLAVYSASKAAVSSLTESLNMEFEKEGIHVSDIRVPFVKTSLIGTSTQAASLKKMGAKLLPEDVAELVFSSLETRKIHYEGKGMTGLLMLRKLLPEGLQKKILRYVMMPES
ncbi:MAG: SDR family oxidoreductase [Desulfobacteraceae bacterium]